MTVIASVSGGVIAGFALGALAVLFALLVLFDWRGFGRRFFEFSCDLPLPGVSYYERLGFRSFRFGLGSGFLAIGILILSVSAAATG